MNLSSPDASDGVAATAHSKPTVKREQRFYLVTATFILLVTFAGFMRTYYLRDVFGSPELDKFLHVHGAIMSAWIVLLLIQVVLITSKRIVWHRRLGAFGVSVATLVFVMGAAATLRAAAREVASHSDAINQQLEILALELTQVILFAAFFSLNIWNADRREIHKRLMVLATPCILPNPIVRIGVRFHIDSVLAFILIWGTVVVAVVLLDGWINGRVRRRFVVYSCLAIAVMFAAHYIGPSPMWIAWSMQLVS